MRDKEINTKILVIGSGLSGMLAAIEASKGSNDVTIVSKGIFAASGSSYVTRGGFSIALSKAEGDSSKLHFEDTICAGKRINNQKLVKILTTKAPKFLEVLKKYGIKFFKKNCHIKQYLGAGHSVPRMLYTLNKNGPDITIPLGKYIKENTNIKIIPQTLVFCLNKVEDCFIANCYDYFKEESFVICTQSIVIATGGGARIYQFTRNPEGNTGDGFALAYNAGAELIDMEFIQHYPLEVFYPRNKDLHADISASLPSLGAVTRNKYGVAFMKKYDSNGDLATRDSHSRGLYSEIKAGNGIKGGVWLDFSGVNSDDLKDAIPEYYRYFKKKKISKKNWKVIVGPGAHYFMGGIKINEDAESTIKGLFACGEVTGGVHGANRLACNSLPDCLVFGIIAGRNSLRYIKKHKNFSINVNLSKYSKDVFSIYKENFSKNSNIERYKKNLRKIMWNNVGLIRSGNKMKAALEYIENILRNFQIVKINAKGEIRSLIEFKNMLITSKLVVLAALNRRESRGSHYRVDYPNEKDAWQKSIIIKR